MKSPARCHPDRPNFGRELCQHCYRAAGFEHVDKELERRRGERRRSPDFERSRYHTDPRVRERLKKRAEALKGVPLKDRMSPEAYARRLERARVWQVANKGIAAAHARARGMRLDQVSERRAKENAWRVATGRVITSMAELHALADATYEELMQLRDQALAQRVLERRDRARQSEERARAAATPIPTPHQGHELFDRAAELVRGAWYGEDLYDPTGEDARSEAVLAMLEGRDPEAAAIAFRKREAGWRRSTTTIPDWRL